MTKDDFGRQMPYDNATVEQSIRSLRRWRDDPDGYPFVVGAVLPVLQAYEKVYADNVRYLLERRVETVMSRPVLYVAAYFMLWRFAFGGDPFGRTRVLWEARFKLLGIHAAVIAALVSLYALAGILS